CGRGSGRSCSSASAARSGSSARNSVFDGGADADVERRSGGRPEVPALRPGDVRSLERVEEGGARRGLGRQVHLPAGWMLGPVDELACPRFLLHQRVAEARGYRVAESLDVVEDLEVRDHDVVDDDGAELMQGCALDRSVRDRAETRDGAVPEVERDLERFRPG